MQQELSWHTISNSGGCNMGLALFGRYKDPMSKHFRRRWPGGAWHTPSIILVYFSILQVRCRYLDMIAFQFSSIAA